MDLHMIDFEREALFQQALAMCCQANEKFKAKTLREALTIVCPEFTEGLFEPRPCVRKLKFVGQDQALEYGKIYESVDFNGGTYQIKGIDGRMGCAYFEIC